MWKRFIIAVCIVIAWDLLAILIILYFNMKNGN